MSRSGLNGKVVVVTGAAHGQGAAHVVALRSEGAVVVGVDADPFGGDVIRHDVTRPEDWDALVTRLRVEHGGRVDGLVNNAGVTSRARLPVVERDDWERTFAVNVTGPLLAIQKLLPLMSPSCSIVNVGSVAALSGHYAAAYTASKWALRGLSATASLELGTRGIRVNTIHPGYVETAMTASAPAAFRTASETLVPLGRLGTPPDVTGVVAFLLSADSAWITGAEIVVDGGQTAHGGTKALSDALR